MSRPSYRKALDQVLRAAGFAREGTDWTRTRGDIWNGVNLQKSWIDGSVTVNLYAKDLETERILRSIACETVLGVHPAYERIGKLIDGRDRWWKNDPDGPTEIAEAMRTHGLPWFDQVQSLEEQAEHWYFRHAPAEPWKKKNLPALVVTLYRLGALDEALALFDAPVPRTANERMVAEARCVQRWLQDRARNTSFTR